MVIAINKKYQKIINKFITADAAHNQAVDAENLCETDRQFTANMKLQERTYDKASDLFAQLTKREISNINKNGICTVGY